MSGAAVPTQPIQVRFRGGGFAPIARRWVGLFVFVFLIGITEIGT